MARLRMKHALRERLKAIRELRDEGLKASDNPAVHASVRLNYRTGQAVERWLDDHAETDSADIVNAMLASGQTMIRNALRLASKEPEQRGVILSRLMVAFIQREVDSGFIKPPAQHEIAKNATSRSLLGPDGKPYKVQ